MEKLLFSASNLLSNPGLFLLTENVNTIGGFDLKYTDRVYDHLPTDKFGMNLIETSTMCF